MPDSQTLDSQFDGAFHKALVDNLVDGVYFVDPGREIKYWNPGAERITGYGPGDVVGHRCFDNILDHVDSQGYSLCRTECPLAATMRDGQPREVSVWLRHADGHRKPVLVRTAPVRSVDGTIVGAVEVFSDDSALLRAVAGADRASHDALTDDLTGLPNRRLFDAALSGRLENLARYGWRFGLLIVDIDHFKGVNDSLGHAFGDAALAGVAASLSGAVRTGDILARWGGDEFAVLVESSNEAGLMETAARLQALVATSQVRLGGLSRTVQVSIGGALAGPVDSAATLFARADGALFAAKHAGRNRIEISEPV
jgi:diguanylate cyclase (GGDEF)-like protein/PAS domain S-box-containing protein